MGRMKKARVTSTDKRSAVSQSGDPSLPVANLQPAIPLAAVLSFVKETRGALTWSTKDMVRSLKIAESEANQIIAILCLQGYAKPATENDGWLTTPAGEEVSESRMPRFARDKVDEALSLLVKRIKSINEDRKAKFHISEAVVYGDLLLGRPIVQAADVGIDLVAGKQKSQLNSSKETVSFLKLLRGKSLLLQLHPYQPWMAGRSHRKLI
jgi:hypothetical protein